MTISINPGTSVKDIQQAFKKAYPHLRIVLYKLKPGRLSGVVRTRMGAASSMASVGLSREISITIDPCATIQQLEKIFAAHVAVAIELRVQSGGIWKAGEKGDDRTLAELNQ